MIRMSQILLCIISSTFAKLFMSFRESLLYKGKGARYPMKKMTIFDQGIKIFLKFRFPKSYTFRPFCLRFKEVCNQIQPPPRSPQLEIFGNCYLHSLKLVTHSNTLIFAEFLYISVWVRESVYWPLHHLNLTPNKKNA